MVEIKIETPQGRKLVKVKEEETLLTALRRAEVFLQAPCNGRGTCGRCKVRLNGEKEEVLACQTYPVDGMTVESVFDASRIDVVSEFLQQTVQSESEEVASMHYAIAIDLGTTTVVLQLLRIDLGNHNHQILQTIRSLNPQSTYGADVISRMTAANEGKGKELQACICRLLCESIQNLCHTNDLSLEEIKTIAIAGNTTMMHLLRGYDVGGLGKYPFSPVNLRKETFLYRELDDGRERNQEPTVILFPGISAFVGGDITAGLLALQMAKRNELSLFVDLGTNGELAIGNKERILVSSTAAGPAFEGGNLSCGIGSIPGAIKEVTIKKRYVSYQTIDNRPAVGFCGTGAIDLLAELWTNGMIDEHGTFQKEEYREHGYPIEVRGRENSDAIRFTQRDIRQMQLAKAAIRAGMEVLMTSFGVDYTDIAHLYLAGGMGFSLDVQKACAIGLLPMELKEKVEIVGNSCIGGVIAYLTQGEEAGGRMMDEVLDRVESIQLAEEDLFASNYVQYMDFET